MPHTLRNALGLIALALCIAGGVAAWNGALRGFLPQSTSSDAAAARAQAEVAAAFGQLEKGMREGNGELLLALMDRASLNKTDERMREFYRTGIPAQPWISLKPAAITVRNGMAFVVGSYANPPKTGVGSYLVRFVREDGAWKIAEETVSDAPPYPPSVHAFLPPEDGTFTRAGKPWERIPYAEFNTKYFKDVQPWKMQAVRDEEFLYVRFEAGARLPAPDTEVSEQDAKNIRTGVPGLPAMVINISTADDKQTVVKTTFGFQIGANIGDRATFDANGKANSHHYMLVYSLLVRNERDESAFDSSPGAFNSLITVEDRFIDLRFPLRALGLDEKGRPDIVVREYNSLPRILARKAERFAS